MGQAIIIFIVPLVITVLFSMWLHRITHPKIIIRVTPSEIEVGDLKFSRADFHGFRIGGTESGKESQGSDWDPSALGHNQLVWTALRPKIGDWGEELPYMVPKSVAHDYVIWLNELVAYVGAPPPKATAPEEGRREQRF